MDAATTHPNADTLAAFALGRLAESQRSAVETHVESCDTCCRRLSTIGGDSLVDLARDAMMQTMPLAGPDTAQIDGGVPPELVDHPRYRILGRLGAGGMGVVYRAEHRVMGRVVALKVLSRQTVARPGAIDRFRREVRLASRLAHPNIVTAFDADEARGLHFLVMEFVDGVSLDRLVGRKGPLPIATACLFARQTAIGLQHAHDKGMVHRDVKPHNLVVTRKGHVKILDFGLARVHRTDEGPATSATVATMTAPELVLGTPDFLAPEQAQTSLAVDHRADLYALGGTLVFLLTGKPPFAGTTPMEKLVAHVSDPPPDLTALRPDVPPELAAIVLRLMAKNPADRFPTAAEVAAALQPFVKTGLAPATSATTPVVLDAEPVEVEVATSAGETMNEVPPQTPPSRGLKPKVRKPRKPSRSFFVRYRGVVAVAVVAAALLPLLPWTVNAISGLVSGVTPPRKSAVHEVHAHTETAPTPTAHPRIVLVVPSTNLWYADYGPLRERLEQGGAKVRVAAPKVEWVTTAPGSPGPRVKPNAKFDDVAAKDYDAVVFLGVPVNEYTTGTRAAHTRDFIDQMVARGRVVGAICAGQRVLGDLGYLSNRTAARPLPFVSDNLSVGRWVDQSVARDGPFVTGGRDTDAVPFAEALLEAVAHGR